MQGDLVHVKWTYLGVRGPVMSEEFFVLLEKCSSHYSENETWEVIQKNLESGSVRYSTISCLDYDKNLEDGQLEIMLVSRAHQELGNVDFAQDDRCSFGLQV